MISYSIYFLLRHHNATKHKRVKRKPQTLLTNKSQTSPDRPLIRIKRKGRPFATCSICNATPCEAPTEHARLKREAELKSPSSKVTQLHTQKPAVSTTGRADLRNQHEEEMRDGMVLMFLLGS